MIAYFYLIVVAFDRAQSLACAELLCLSLSRSDPVAFGLQSSKLKEEFNIDLRVLGIADSKQVLVDERYELDTHPASTIICGLPPEGQIIAILAAQLSKAITTLVLLPFSRSCSFIAVPSCLYS